MGAKHTAEETKTLSLASVLKRAPTGLISDFSRHNSFYSVQLSGSLEDVIEFFGMGLHRVCVLNDQREFKGVLSQSDALRYLAKHLDEIPFVADKTLEELGLCSIKPLTASQNGTVLQALMTMHDNSVSSIAIVDNSGALVANLSMTDIKVRALIAFGVC